MITITALASGRFVLTRRFDAEPGWRRRAILAVAAGMATIVFIATGGRGGLAVDSRPARARRLGPAAGEAA